ncbi:hypothetical protein [Limnoglobus roseus]|uniref:Uncharacterized protein n=1 Tax=Limnoglobus roseus TaxID=2598579 RepID=A0A5C1A7U8_9BACT|nr:hypothetical protein [Limnoglobus roseus]QEL15389.1 hypothetical protein PX52LOC_02304 [Limnoglobus roseus]
MSADPLFELLGMALELMHKPFLVPGDPRSAELEFYHQFRKLWDRGIPVGLGLGHILLHPTPDGMLRIDRLAEKGQPAECLALIAFTAAEFPPTACRHRVRIAPTGDRWQIQNPG